LGYAAGHIYAWQGVPHTWTGGGDDLVKYTNLAVREIWIPVNNLEMLAPSIGLTVLLIIAVTTVIYSKSKKGRQ